MNFKRWVEVRQAYLPFLFCILILTISAYKVVVQPLSHVLLFATPWTAACQASLSLTIFWSLFKFMYKAVYSFSIIGYRGCNQCDFSIDHLVMAMCKVVSCVVENVFAITSSFSWQNSISLWPTSFCSPRPNSLLCQVFLVFLLLHSNHQWWIEHHFFDVSSRRSSRYSENWSTLASAALVVGTFECLALEINWGHSVIFYITPKYCISDSFFFFFWLWELLHFFYGILAHSSRYNGHLN